MGDPLQTRHYHLGEEGIVPQSASPKEYHLTGGSADYYKKLITHPTTATEPYVAECNDIIEALRMTFAEANVFKAVWRSAAARDGNGKPGTSALYDAQKVVFFGQRMVVATERDVDERENGNG